VSDRVAFTVAGAAAPQGSKRHVGKGVLVEASKRVKPWRNDVRMVAGLAMSGDPWEGPVAVEVDFRYRRPASHLRTDGVSLSATGRRFPCPTGSGDVDKLLRAVLDALTSIVFHDDRQVAQVVACKQWGDRDEARVVVRRLAAGVELSAPAREAA